MEPALGVHVAAALDRDMAVSDEEFDVAAARVEGLVDRADLVFADVVADMQALAALCWQRGDEGLGKHFVGAALAGHEFAGVIVAEADVVGDFDTTGEGGGDGGVEGRGVKVGGLNEDGVAGVAEGA